MAVTFECIVHAGVINVVRRVPRHTAYRLVDSATRWESWSSWPQAKLEPQVSKCHANEHTQHNTPTAHNWEWYDFKQPVWLNGTMLLLVVHLWHKMWRSGRSSPFGAIITCAPQCGHLALSVPRRLGFISLIIRDNEPKCTLPQMHALQENKYVYAVVLWNQCVSLLNSIKSNWDEKNFFFEQHRCK